jgi:TRAP-type C4-dicarboxylate transport system permease small subunit
MLPDFTAARVLHWLSRVERWLVLSAFLVLVLVVFADVVARELTGNGLYWASQTAIWANVLVVMAGFGLASAQGAHLRPRFSDDWLPAAWGPVLRFLQHLVMALFCSAIGALAAWVTYGSWQLGEISIDLLLPIWPVQMFLPLAFFSAGLRHLLYAIYTDLRPPETGGLAVLASESDA